MKKYKIVYVDGYAEVLSECDMFLIDCVEQLEELMRDGVGDNAHIINWNNVVSVIYIEGAV